MARTTLSTAAGAGARPPVADRLDALGYVLACSFATLAAARVFYGYMLTQTGGEWSAPLDDVFIHFDYARATARGYPFEWSEGNGFSSGNTSLLYPFVLAVGWWMPFFRGGALMIWAAIVACASVVGMLLASRRLFDGLPRWAKYLAPAAFFSIGALDWSLFSGMEVALYLGVWGGGLGAAYAVADRAGEPRAETRAAWLLGAWGVAIVTTRPEGATSVAVLGAVAAWAVARKAFDARAVVATRFAAVVAACRAAFGVLVRAGSPAAAALALQAVVNRALTGEWQAAGAVVKLVSTNPFATTAEKRATYDFLLDYVIDRNVEHHFTDAKPFGSLVLLLAALPLVSAKTRRAGVLLWASTLAWFPTVALNQQVRWQNERYTMPGVAFLLLAAAVGVASMLEPAWIVAPRALAAARPRLARALRGGSIAAWHVRAAVVAFAVLTFLRHEAPQMRDQIWFFGRASRNIRDQHLTAGKLLRAMSPPPRRLLVGDAGALLYASDLPGLDLIGLGGYHDLPFARAGVHGLGATLELIERMPAADRPDAMAIYPTWWGDLPIWFGQRLFAVPVPGNVICGGYEKVVYRADWRALGHGERPRSLGATERVVDELDVADLVSERAHGYSFDPPSAGWAEAKLLPDPDDRETPMFEGGRRMPPGKRERFALQRSPGHAARVVFRVAPERRGRVEVTLAGAPAGVLELEHEDGWRELSIDVPATLVGERVEVETKLVEGPDWVDYHVWSVEAP